MAFRPETAKPINELANILLLEPHSLSRGERELIATHVSCANECQFCQTIHGAYRRALSRRRSARRCRPRSIRRGGESLAKLKALLNIAGKVARSGRDVTADDIARARGEGATDLEIHDTVLIAALFCLCNRYVDGLATDMPESLDYFRERVPVMAAQGYQMPPRAPHRASSIRPWGRPSAPSLPSSTKAHLRYEGWRVAAASALGMLVGFASVLVYTFGIFLKPISETFDWNRESVSGAFGIAAMTAAVCAPLTGMLLDRFGPRGVILPAIVVFGAAFASISLLTPHLVAPLRAVRGVRPGRDGHVAGRLLARDLDLVRRAASAPRWPSACAGAPSARWSCHRSRSASSTRSAGGSPRWSSASRSSRSACRPCSRSSGSGRAAARRTAAPPGPARRSARACAAYRFWILVIVLFCISIAQNGAVTHLSALLTDRGLTADRAAIAVSALGGAALAGRLGTGWLLDRFFAPWVSFALLVHGRARRLPAVGGGLAHRRRPGRGADRLQHGRRGRRHPVPRRALLRAALVLGALRAHLDVLRGRRGHRPRPDGQGIRCERFVRVTLLLWIAGSILVVAPLMLVLPRYETPAHRRPLVAASLLLRSARC